MACGLLPKRLPSELALYFSFVYMLPTCFGDYSKLEWICDMEDESAGSALPRLSVTDLRVSSPSLHMKEPDLSCCWYSTTRFLEAAF